MALKAFQQNYWNRPSTVVIPPPGPSRGGYPGWQASVVASLFGALWELGAAWWSRLGWWGRLLRRIAQLSAPQRVWVDRVLRVVPSDDRAEAPSVEWMTRVSDLGPTQRAVIERALTLVESPHFPIAQSAVRVTATTLGFSRPEAWQQYSRAIKGSPGRAENVFRHIKAHELTRQGARDLGSTLSNPTAHLLVELAYHEFAIKGR